MRKLSGTDPDYAPVIEVFDNLSHAEIHQAVQRLDPAALSAAGDAFLTTATGLGDEVDNAHGEIRAALADGWRGSAAQQAVDAVSEFEQAGRRIADVLTAVGVRLSRAGDAAESVRAAIAEPDAAQPDPSAALLDSQQAADNATVVREAENARLDAVRAMETIYGGALVPTGSGVPSFPVLDTTSGTAPGTDTALTGGTPAVTLTGANPAAVAPPTTTTGETQVAGVVTVLPADTTAPTPGQPQTPSATPATTSAPGTVTAAAAPTVPATTAQPGRVGTTSTTTSASGGTPAAGTPGAVMGSVPGADPRNRRDRSGKPAATPGTGTTTAGSTPGSDTGAAATDARPDRDVTAAGGEAAAGMSAGAIGGLMGGAMAAADNHRSPGGPRHPAPPEELEDEDDEFLRFLDEEPTYLEPADEVNALIGRMEPTSPAVLGEWTERE
ncbi:WXG100 family type VII secretion target [Nocardia sp. AG03]|uniref:WXG100 family type VII secretion target n=1 Tax=Nocardia sp. AG03 TaxID=3025312 RepID=UPI002418ABDE|nr:WXG100 family type VII secretion target [Nocardia sp. AG03]